MIVLKGLNLLFSLKISVEWPYFFEILELYNFFELFWGFSGQNGFGDYQEQPQLNYAQYSDQEFSYQQYQEYSDQNEVFNQYGPGQSFLFE